MEGTATNREGGDGGGGEEEEVGEVDEEGPGEEVQNASQAWQSGRVGFAQLETQDLRAKCNGCIQSEGVLGWSEAASVESGARRGPAPVSMKHAAHWLSLILKRRSCVTAHGLLPCHLHGR